MSNQTNTELNDATAEMANTTNRRPSPRRRRLIQAATATVTALLGAVVFTGAPASASNSSVYFPNGYTADASAGVTCDRANRTIMVNSIDVSVMRPSYSTGGVAGAYDSGQNVRYDVWISVDHGTPTQLWSWSAWKVIRGVTVAPGTYYSGPISLYQTTQLNAPLRITGGSGHTYQLAVRVDWWTGVENVANLVWPAITYTLAVGGLGQTLSSCAF